MRASYSSASFQNSIGEKWKNDFLGSAVIQQRGRSGPVINRKADSLERVFARQDPFGSGTVSTKTLDTSLREAGVFLTEPQFDKLLKTHTKGMKGNQLKWQDLCKDLRGEVGQQYWIPNRPEQRLARIGPHNKGMRSSSSLPHLKVHNYRPPTPLKPVKARSAAVEQAAFIINMLFSNMFNAYRSVDLDNSGRIGRTEIMRLLASANLAASESMLDEIFGDLDVDGDGISYPEFVAALANDTVQTGMASWEREVGVARNARELNIGAGVVGQVESKRLGEKNLVINSKQGLSGKSGNVTAAAKAAMATRFANMRAAFKHADLDGSGTVSVAELEHALKMLNIPIDREEVIELAKKCDASGDGDISYAEFADLIAGRQE